ncbi:lipid A-modifier LpxR family protein [Henriciella sp.]|uniref:lipid A-modifier LpxR family protein n=1 Tax=Henriciella sp. TaxID=1968823 RepID=UPI0026344EA0|nr:lipid A-modifier LpxR family protein [Henriciella sp.]
MILSVSTLMVLACQGCEALPANNYSLSGVQSEVVTYQSEEEGARKSSSGRFAQAVSVPALQAGADVSVLRSQTDMQSSFSAPPVLGQGSINAKIGPKRDFSVLRISNAPGIIDFESARTSANLASPARAVKAFDASVALSAGNAQTGLGFDVGVVPRMSVRQDGQFETRRFGGEIRIGQNFDQRGEDVDAKSWYLFAGADGEALVYEPYRERKFTNSMALRDQVTVGDMQAGVSFTRGSGQLSLSYIRREVEYNERGIRGQEETEDFAGISFTLRR